MATNYRVQLIGKKPLYAIDGAPYAIWSYELIAEAPLSFAGDIGFAFSKDLIIKDPAQYPDVTDVKGSTLQRAEGGSVQYVYISVPTSGLASGGATLSIIAPSAESSSVSISLVTKNPDDTAWETLSFTGAGDAAAATTLAIRGPAVISNSNSVLTPPPILPYASEPFGVYQPLIGWRSSLATEKLAGAMAYRFRIAASLLNDQAALSTKDPLAKLVTTTVTDRTGTAVGRQLAQGIAKSQTPVTEATWSALANDNTNLSKIAKEVSSNIQKSALQLSTVRANALRTTQARPAGQSQSSADLPQAATNEIAMASLISHLSQSAPGVLSQMFTAKISPWERALSAVTWFGENLPAKLAYLSPIGILHLFREYFFELGTFLGPPVGHVWLSPGGTVELIEGNTRRTLVEQTISQETETTQKTELDQTNEDELSDAVKVENANDTKLGVTAQASGGVGSVFQASASGSFNLDSSRKQAEEQTHKLMRQQSAKLSSEVRQNYKTTFRTVTETTDTSSRRYVIQNTTDRLVSYELSRKMRKVAVQVQDLGQQLCWQLYIDNPGDTLGLGEFVHATSSALDPGVKQPDTQPYPANQDKVYSLSVPFILYQGADSGGTDTYDTEGANHDHGIFDPDVGKADIIEFKHTFQCPPPPPGFVMSSISAVDFHGAQVSFVVDDADLLPNPNPATNRFTLRLTHAFFNGAPALPFDATITYVPTDDAKKAIDAKNNAATITYNDEVALKKEQLFYDTLRSRLKLIGQVTPRPQGDLREEERSIVFRNIISRLYGNENGWSNDDYHVASELIRYLFDVDAMLYFVAPDWWRPRQQALVDKNDQGELQPTIIADPAISARIERIGKFGISFKPGHRPYYLITEETAPAPMGASLGWLIQLDGDSHRNAFLNSPWVKAVLPIRPGRERDAIAYLQRPEVAGTDGLSEPYPYDATQDPPEYSGKTMQDVLLIIADKIAAEYQASLVPTPLNSGNPNSDAALPTETVYSLGFDPLEGGIKFGSEPFVVFSQWTEVLPTDQVVATEYSLTGL